MSDQDANRGRDVFNAHDELDAYLGRSQAATPGQSVANMIVEAARMTERQSTEDWISSQLERQKRRREAQEAFDAAVPAKRRCKHGTYIPRPGTCPLCEEILRDEERMTHTRNQPQGYDEIIAACEKNAEALIEAARLVSDTPPTPGQSIDSLNASLAAMNKALKELRAAGYSIDVSGGHGGVSYHMSGGPV